MNLSALQGATLPRPPDRQSYSRRLYVDEKRLAVGAEVRAGQLSALVSWHDVFRKIEDLPLSRQASHVLFIASVFANDQTAVRADAEVVRHVEHSLIAGFKDKFELALVIPLRRVLPDLAESLIAAAGRGEVDAVCALPPTFQARECRRSQCEPLAIDRVGRNLGVRRIGFINVHPVHVHRLADLLP